MQIINKTSPVVREHRKYARFSPALPGVWDDFSLLYGCAAAM